MEVHFSFLKKPTSLTKANKDTITDKINKFYDGYLQKLKEGKIKGIPNADKWKANEKTLYAFYDKEIIMTLLTNAATGVNFIKLATPKIAKLSFSTIGVELDKPEITERGAQKWEKKETVTLKKGERWKTLSHNGVYLGEPYKPHKLPLVYNGKDIAMSANDEEIISLYAKQLAMEEANTSRTPYTQKKKFINNFVKTATQPHSKNGNVILESKDLIKILTSMNPKSDEKTVAYKTEVKQFNDMFRKMAKQFIKEKKTKTLEEKKESKMIADKLKREYKFATVDGRTEEIGNFKIEPPGLFLGRGESNKQGCVKPRLRAKDVTLNLSLGKGEKPPKPNDGSKEWGGIVTDNTVTWLATWKESCSGGTKYVYLAATSQIKGEGDRVKFEKARLLGQKIDKIVDTYTKNMKSTDLKKRQLGTIVYLIDKHAFRVGTKEESDNDTVGITTLKVEHIIPQGGNKMTFDFLGKDSIRFYNTLELDSVAYKNLVDFKKGKGVDSQLFNLVNAKDINEHLKEFSKGLSAKVFRTYRASTKYFDEITELMKKSPKDISAAEKLNIEKLANMEVAKLCNHQRKLPKKAIETLETKKKEYEALKKKKSLDKKEETKKKSLEKFIKEKEQAISGANTDGNGGDEMDIVCSTSKTNYIDPRVVIAWAKKYKVLSPNMDQPEDTKPLAKLYTAALQKKFRWAFDTPGDWNYRTSKMILSEASNRSSPSPKPSPKPRAKTTKTGVAKSKSKTAKKTKSPTPSPQEKDEEDEYTPKKSTKVQKVAILRKSPSPVPYSRVRTSSPTLPTLGGVVKVVILLNYGTQTHALFGKFKSEALDSERTKIPIKFVKREALRYGSVNNNVKKPGWLFTLKDEKNLDAFKALLIKSKLPFKEYNLKSSSPSPHSSPSISPVKPKITKFAIPKSKTSKTKRVRKPINKSPSPQDQTLASVLSFKVPSPKVSPVKASPTRISVAKTTNGKKKLIDKEIKPVISFTKDNFVIIQNYGPKTHAIVGKTEDIKKNLSQIKGTLKSMRFLPKLRYKGDFTPGWYFPKDKLTEIKNMLIENQKTFEFTTNN
jgi:DNA topoisomerase-1